MPFYLRVQGQLVKLDANECNANCLQAHTPSGYCFCECAGANHGLWLTLYAKESAKKRKQGERQAAN